MSEFRSKLLGLLRLLLPLSVSERVMGMLEDGDVSSEEIKEYVTKYKRTDDGLQDC